MGDVTAPGGAAETFASELRDLYAAAGCPTLATLVRQAAKQPSPIRLTDSTLSDWLNGRSIPQNPKALWFLVQYLRPIAIRGSGYSPRPEAGWEDLRQQAVAERGVRRGGRPARRADANSISDPDGSVMSPPVAMRVDAADPRMLGVHASIQIDGMTDGLPAYVPRDVDPHLRRLLADHGRGVFVLLVGRSSSGKTRTLFEAVRAMMPDWSLAHPASAEEIRILASVPPARAVVWLDELQRMLQDERPLTAAIVRRLHHAGVVLVGTMWPEEYDERITPREAGSDDRHTADRELLRLATVIEIDDQLSSDERARAESLAGSDKRLRLALDLTFRTSERRYGPPRGSFNSWCRRRPGRRAGRGSAAVVG